MELNRVRLKVLATTAPGGLKLMPPPVDGLVPPGFGNWFSPSVYDPDTALLKAIVELMITALVVGESMLMPAPFALPGVPRKLLPPPWPARPGSPEYLFPN